MRVSNGVTAVFDDPNLVSSAGLVPVLRLVARAGLSRMVAAHVTWTGSCAGCGRRRPFGHVRSSMRSRAGCWSPWPDALVTAGAAGATGLAMLRADAAFYRHDVVAAAVRGGARFSIPPDTTPRLVGRSRRSRRRPGHRSGTPTPSGTRPRRRGSATPRSAKPPTPPAPPAPRPSGSPPG
jgi:hypothetical protein